MNAVATATLHQNAFETATYTEMDAGVTLDISDGGGIEVLVIAGAIIQGDDLLAMGGWLRILDGETLSVTAGPQSAKLWARTGQMPHAKSPPAWQGQRVFLMKILIVGDGLSGLALAERLEVEGHDYQSVDARTRFGGRIQTQHHGCLASKRRHHSICL